MINDNNETVTTFGDERFLPPETSTPMGPMLRWAYDPLLGWPGRPEDDPGPGWHRANVKQSIARFIERLGVDEFVEQLEAGG